MARLLDNGHSIDARDEGESTPLMVAVMCDERDGCEFLMARGADKHLRDSATMCPLHIAVAERNVGMAKLLLDHHVDINVRQYNGLTSLHCAAQMGYEEIVDLLIDYGADLEVKSVDGSTALHLASVDGQRHVVKLLITRGANPDALDDCGRLPLWAASRGGYVKTVRFLAARTKNINTQVYNGPTALSTAARYGLKGTVKALLNAGAEIFPQEPGPHVPWLDPKERLERYSADALTEACLGNSTIVVEMLLATLARSNPEEYAGWLEVWDRAGPHPNRTGVKGLEELRAWVDQRQVLVETPEVKALRKAMVTKVYALDEENRVKLGEEMGIPYVSDGKRIDTLGITHDVGKLAIIDSNNHDEARSEFDGDGPTAENQADFAQ